MVSESPSVDSELSSEDGSSSSSSVGSKLPSEDESADSSSTGSELPFVAGIGEPDDGVPEVLGDVEG